MGKWIVASADDDDDDGEMVKVMEGNCRMEAMELIPGLPEEISWMCLARVSYEWHPQMQAVCRRWRTAMRSSQFYEARKKAGSSRQFVCMLQALPTNSSTDASFASMPPLGISVYDLQQQSWMRLDQPCGDGWIVASGSLPIFSRCVCSSGNLILLGGWSPTTYEALTSVFIYDFSIRRWRRGRDMPSRRSFFACAAVGGACVVVAGGHDDNKEALATAEAYCLRTNTWTELPPMNEARDECVAMEVKGKVYVVSGYQTQTQGRFMEGGEVYDPEVRKWRRIDHHRHHHHHQLWPTTDHSTSANGGAGWIVALAGQQLHVFAGQTVIRYSSKIQSWRAVDGIPAAGKAVAACSVPSADSIAVAAVGLGGDRCNVMSERGKMEYRYSLYLYTPPITAADDDDDDDDGDRNWRRCSGDGDDDDDDFSGLIQSLCFVEI